MMPRGPWSWPTGPKWFGAHPHPLPRAEDRRLSILDRIVEHGERWTHSGPREVDLRWLHKHGYITLERRRWGSNNRTFLNLTIKGEEARQARNFNQPRTPKSERRERRNWTK